MKLEHLIMHKKLYAMAFAVSACLATSVAIEKIQYDVPKLSPTSVAGDPTTIAPATKTAAGKESRLADGLTQTELIRVWNEGAQEWTANSNIKPKRDRETAEQFMLMMQGMAGIGPEDSKWVRDKLFEGFIPAPMPCCGVPGSKNPEDEHRCCEKQKNAIDMAALSGDFAEKARTRFNEQFGPMMGRPIKSSAKTSFVSRQSVSEDLQPDTEGPSDNAFEGLRISVVKPSPGDPPANFSISAISTPIVYNRFGKDFRRIEVNGVTKPFGARDNDGMIFVLDEDIDKVRAGSEYFNAGHDPIFYGVGHGTPLFLKDPGTGRYLDANKQLADEPKVPVLTVEPLIIRANCGDTLVIDFTNRLDVNRSSGASTANLIVEGATYNTGDVGHVGENCVEPVAAGNNNPQLRYVIKIGNERATEGTYYFHSKPIDSKDLNGSLHRMKTQASHGLFGALIVEPKGSKYLDSYTFEIKEGSENGFGDYEVDEDSYAEVKSGWAAIIVNEDESIPAFREHVVMFHDELGDKLMRDAETGSPRALSYRYAGFLEIFGSRTFSGKKSPFVINDHSMAYSAYTYGDASTPHPRFYVGDPMRYRIVHGGAGNEFHVFHHHAHRWRFQPGISEAGAKDDAANLTSPSKRGRPEDPNQPDLTVSASTRIDSQTLGPGETFDVLMEGGAGGTQRTVGDSLLHCHIIDHVIQGMWTYARVYNTLQEPGVSYYPPLAPLPDRLNEAIRPPIAVDSLTLQAMVAQQGAPKPTPVAGPLAGVPITDIQNQLIPYIENQLPPQGVPELDKKAEVNDEHRAEINRANQWDWETIDVPGQGILYLGERYDLGDFHTGKERPQSYVRFGVGYPTAGEGIGVHRNEPNPLGDDLPIDRPRLRFNPKDGRLAYPHLLPHAGRRPPFAPRTRLKPEQAGGVAVVRDEWRQGTAYLNKTVKATDPDSTRGGNSGSGLAPEDAPIRRYDLVALELPINYHAANGKPLSSEEDEYRDFLFGRKKRVPPPQTITITAGKGTTSWVPGTQKIRTGDTIEWIIDNENSTGKHGIKFTNWTHDKEYFQVEQTADSLDFNETIGQNVDPADPERLRKGASNVKGQLLLRVKVLKELAVGSRIAYVCTEHGDSMSGALTASDVAPGVDEKGQIFVLAEDFADIAAGRKPAEPLVLRANVGEVVEVTLRSALRDDDADNAGYSKVGIHTHLVQYDVQSSDGAVGGLNYETSIRPSLELVDGKLVPLEPDRRLEEAVHYRWWCDTELGTVYFHDHSLLKTSLPHGLFGATIVEPSGSSYHDPISGKPIYEEETDPAEPNLTTISKSNATVMRDGTDSWGRGVSIASIHNAKKTSTFREYVPLFQDRSTGIGASINLRSTPIRTFNHDFDGKFVPGLTPPFSNLKVNYDNGHSVLLGGKATRFSSHVSADPVTPVWRAFPNDPARIRVEGGATNLLHSLTVHGHRWQTEQNNPKSTIRDFAIAGVSEAFTYGSIANASPGDYLYGSTGVNDLVDQGKWGIWRVHDPADSNNLVQASGTARVFFLFVNNNPALPFSIPKGTRFVSRAGIEYEATHNSQELNQEKIDKGDSFIDVSLRAVFPGDSGNLPILSRLGFSKAFNNSVPESLIIDRVVSLGISGGATKLQPLPGFTSNVAPAVAAPLVESLGITEAPEPIVDKPEFYVAALRVSLPVSTGTTPNATTPILAYVPLETEQERSLADQIASLTRSIKPRCESEKQSRRDKIDLKIFKLRQHLLTRFLAHPHPLVLRVAAPEESNTRQVSVRLINLLPTPQEMMQEFPDTAARPFGSPYSPLTSIHASLVKHDASSDGTALGRNNHSVVPYADARTYLWSIDQELGICYLRDTADPEHQTSGLFGALIVEPPGTRFLSGTDGMEKRGVSDPHAIIIDRSERIAFREYVLFFQDAFHAQDDQFAINYMVAGDSGTPRTPHLKGHVGDQIRVRQVHAAGSGAQAGNHSFYIGGRRWRMDNADQASNRIAAISQAPAACVNAEFLIDDSFSDEAKVKTRSYFYGSHVGDQYEGGEWGLFTILPRTESNFSILQPLPVWAGNTHPPVSLE
ncbi:Multicopper oxidase [Gimesia maris]|uniref:hypothetical protein n=1 Tax=Gimesia maris TaxID=122 RepID=UPI001188D062|nr:hypothetical protein [Gimesia maris]QDT79651.1 Multicopper oxidase [Gimesia maris]